MQSIHREQHHRSVQSASVRTAARRRVGFVGGVERIERELLACGEELGLHIEFHGGHTRGNGKARLEALVHRADLVVIITGTNSHNAVHVAKREAAKHGVEVRILKACGAQTARSLLSEVAQAAA